MSNMDGFKADLEEIAKEIDAVIQMDDVVSADGIYSDRQHTVIGRHLANSNKLWAVIAKQLLSIQLQMAENAQASTVYRGRE